MPTTYAHDLFGKMVYQKVDEKVQRIIRRHRMAYTIGLHGPDILFYLQPFRKNPVNQLGHEMHRQEAAGFFEKCRGVYLRTGNEELLSYLLGFMCHFMLDSTCHPFIGDYIEKTGASHDEIETEFDRELMEMTGKDPYHYHPASVIRVKKSCVQTIASVLDGVTEKNVCNALHSMKLYTGITVCGNSFKREAMLKVAKLSGIYGLVQGRIMRTQPVERCIRSTRELKRLFKLAIPETVSVLDDFYLNIDRTGELNARFNRNYN